LHARFPDIPQTAKSENDFMKFKLSCRSCALAIIAASSWSNLATAAPPKDKLNVLFIISDDLNNFEGCYGDSRAKTPNIDRLASRGVRFDRAYCQFPLCAPSRNSFLTGLYPNSSGILANGLIFRQTVPKQVSLPQAFRLAGYFAARIGKLYHYGVPNSIGTDGADDPASWELEMNPAGVDRLVELPKVFTFKPGEWGGTLSWYASPHPAEQHTDAISAANAEWVLEHFAKQDRPFFLAVGFFRPHTPYVSPKDYWDLYPREEMPVVRGVKKDQADIPPVALQSYKTPPKMTDDQRRECVQGYRAAISFMDTQVGHVVDALDRLGLAKNTVIVFTSDHGYHMGEHGLWQKMSIFEESARVPLLIVAPKTSKSGAVARTPVGLIDLYPTLTQLCGVKAPDNLQGQSLVPILKDTNTEGRGWALSQVTRGGGKDREQNRIFGYSLRTPRWRYTEWDEGKQGRELYDHDRDAKELTNLADNASEEKTVATLTKQLHAAIAATFPPSGHTPPVKEGQWQPNLTTP
jgi:arylsulfatase A-like enzyme